MSSTDPALEPALAPPPGVTPNFDNPPNENALITGIISMYLVLTTSAVAARMFTRSRVIQELWWDDWMMVIAWIGMVGLAACQLLQLHYGGGVDLWNVTKDQFSHYENIFAITEIVARISIFFAKFSILLLFLRVFYPVGARRTKLWWWIWGLVAFELLYTVAVVLVIALQCVPQGLSLGAVCIDEYTILITVSVINVVSDTIVLIIPMIAVAKLRMNFKKKVGLGVIFAFGALAPISSVVRLGYQIPQAGNQNRTIFLVNVCILSFAEHVIAILVGCLPVLSIWFYRAQNARHARAELARRVSSRMRRRRDLRSPINMHALSRRSNPYPMLDMDDVEGEYENMESVKGDSEENVVISPARTDSTWIRDDNQRDSGILTIEVEPRPKAMTRQKQPLA